MLKVKRVYEKYDQSDGFRILVDRLWPRGVSKADAHVDLWIREIAPSTNLRKWFSHDPNKWEEFRHKYIKELHQNQEVVDKVKQIIKENNDVTFIYAAKDELHNDAVVLYEYFN